MKSTKTILALIILIMMFVTNPAKAQHAGMEEIKIKTSATCDMCKETIEKSLAFEKGIKRSTLDVPSKIVTVIYNPKKTTPEKIRLAIANTGYDADDILANPKAYNKLDECCKKGKVCEDKK